MQFDRVWLLVLELVLIWVRNCLFAWRTWFFLLFW